MANGDKVKFGTFYMNGTPHMPPTYPYGQSHTGTPSSPAPGMTTYTSGNLEIRDTTTDGYAVPWVEFHDPVQDKLLYICDRCLVGGVPWDTLNTQKLVMGKEVTIDGRRYLLRLMTGGSRLRSSGEFNSGMTPADNEWDRIVCNEGSYSGLPTPVAADLTGFASSNAEARRIATHNQFWNWFYQCSWMQEDYLSASGSNKTVRGHSAASSSSFYSPTTATLPYGWRPVLESLESGPVISDKDQNLGSLSSPLQRSYSVSEGDGGSFKILEYLDNTLINTIDPARYAPTTYLYDLTPYWQTMAGGTHTAKVVAQDTKGQSSTRTWTFTKAGSSPLPPTLLAPATGQRVEASTYVEFFPGFDAENDPQTPKVEVSESIGFEAPQTFATGLQKQNSATGAWENATTLTNADQGTRCRIPVTLTNGTSVYIRVGCTDTGTGGTGIPVWSNSVLTRVGTLLDVQMHPYETASRAVQVIPSVRASIDPAAIVSLLVSNNANDANPTWEDATETYKKGGTHIFSNQTKTAGSWAVSLRLQVRAGEATGTIEASALGLGVLL